MDDDKRQEESARYGLASWGSSAKTRERGRNAGRHDREVRRRAQPMADAEAWSGAFRYGTDTGGCASRAHRHQNASWTGLLEPVAPQPEP